MKSLLSLLASSITLNHFTIVKKGLLNMAKKLSSAVVGDLGALVVSTTEKTFLVADGRLEVTLVGQANPSYKSAAIKGFRGIQKVYGEDSTKIPTEELEAYSLNLIATRAIKGIYSLVSEQSAVELGMQTRKEYLSDPTKTTPAGYVFIAGIVIDGTLYENTPEDLKEVLNKLTTVKDEIAGLVNDVANFQVGKLADLD